MKEKLTAAQKHRAGSVPVIRIPWIVAGRVCRMFGKKHHDDILSMAFVFYLRYIREFDSRKSPDGKEGIFPYVYRYTFLGVIASLRRQIRKDLVCKTGMNWDELADHLRGVRRVRRDGSSCSVEAREAWELLSRLPARQREVMERTMQGDRTVHVSMGITHQAVHRLRAKAIRNLRLMYENRDEDRDGD